MLGPLLFETISQEPQTKPAGSNTRAMGIIKISSITFTIITVKFFFFAYFFFYHYFQCLVNKEFDTFCCFVVLLFLLYFGTFFHPRIN